ncbi:helix-turn-helix transcriptional regulator [Streptomyces sp. AV19]|uniref:helix-turn-helix domain-containing protein n=1 Tax=Streptomyces sp. AV19 TaxID=2793068 RepID=UPI0018FE5339|nr:helix-turn-helix transcriptional regulator [Streptomyces sp. AV19]MBH1935855.1 helix-turn-helix transcriptional regulator [Streptomyces sp. AV19]MDG4534361.1 helix-turn-helix domain-containing protein [Streptomyces sp. AV19]
MVTGHLLKIIRERMPRTQRQLAELLRVDPTTVQGWESGRRPLTAVPASQLLTLRRRLLGHGADPELLVQLDAAMDADSVIAHVLHDAPADGDIDRHPLSGWVFTRAATHMIAWALTGVRPTAVPGVQPARRRGPVPDSPMMAAAERRLFFARIRRSAEIADLAGEKGALLRRQALYLCSYDTAGDTHAWLAHMQNRRPHRLTHEVWTPAWADARSMATSLTRYGDLDSLHIFIQRGISSDSGEMANLNYWAHWLGLDKLPRSDDSFMAERSQGLWDASSLLRRLVDRLDPSLACVDLNVHSVWSLLALRPSALAVDTDLARNLQQRVARLLDSRSVSQQARRELDAVHYGLRLSRP